MSRRKTRRWKTKAMRKEQKSQRAKKQSQKAMKMERMSKLKGAVAAMFLLRRLLA